MMMQIVHKREVETGLSAGGHSSVSVDENINCRLTCGNLGTFFESVFA